MHGAHTEVEGGRPVIEVPGDKSISHRALLLSVLADGESRLTGVLTGEDCRSTASVLRDLGASLPPLPGDGSEFRVQGVGPQGLRSPSRELDCGNSGTTARLLLGLLSGLTIEATLTGDASLRSRPMRRVTEPLSRMGARFQEFGVDGRLPIGVSGGALRSIVYTNRRSSAQVKGALLLAGVTGGVEIEISEPAPSRDHTERMLRRLGVRVDQERTPDGWKIHLTNPPARLRPLDLHVPGDFSSAAFLIAFGLLGGAGGPLRIRNVGLNPTRTGLLDVLGDMGAEIEVENLREETDPAGEPAGDLVVTPSELRGGSVGGEMIPRLIDEIPVLAVLATRARGTTEIRDAAELRVKESDRIRVMADNLGRIGARVSELPDGLRIEGDLRPLAGRVAAHGDHRVAMAFGVLGGLAGHRIQVDDPAAAGVSFPGFWDLLAELGRMDGDGGVAGRAMARTP
ncbi:MAG: 3-phosphoshikimate 1-carboxyvinyltransferase [Gemmatimonadetes bacterium]|nr:3-phosphoshikimate 1-carboxyvinyltransferase [Gemmatimonadota bacterium]